MIHEICGLLVEGLGRFTVRMIAGGQQYLGRLLDDLARYPIDPSRQQVDRVRPLDGGSRLDQR